MKIYTIAIFGAMYSIRKIIYLFIGLAFFTALISAKHAYYDQGQTYYFSTVEFSNMFVELYSFQFLLLSLFSIYYLLKFSLDNVKILKKELID